MIKEAKNVDFNTTGRQPSEQDFALISEWIKNDKEKRATRKDAKQTTDPVIVMVKVARGTNTEMVVTMEKV